MTIQIKVSQFLENLHNKISYSTAIYDRNNNLLNAHIADDEQWRFPLKNTIPKKYITSLICFEDKRFFAHNGVDFVAFSRALYSNITERKIVSGGSTITMQTIRLLRKGKKRTYKEKLIEIFLAFQFEKKYSKYECLKIYASHAPYGGNVVGLNTAAWRYFKRSPEQLSWAENCLLAVLPNSPSLIHPGKNRIKLIKKRNTLLQNLYRQKFIDQETYELSLLENIPDKPIPFPNHAYHLLQSIRKKNPQQNTIITSIDLQLQKRVNQLLLKYHKILTGKEIQNIAVLVVKNNTGEVLSYCGNTPIMSQNKNSFLVDIIPAPRSSGSILKPILYAAMLTSGEILPTALVPDIPTFIGSYHPQNYSLNYDGAVPAKKALARSLNVPAVRMLQDYGVAKFHHILIESGITTLTFEPSHYGLSLILGGAEISLWNICSVYSSMARSLNNYEKFQSKYEKYNYHPLTIIPFNNKNENIILLEESHLSASAIWLTFKAMIDVERPDEDKEWEYFDSEQKIAWKTGTSFGFRDAWAIGITPDYTVAVWVGNASGEGRPELVGIKAAAPILFDVFKLIPKSNKWFSKPFDDMLQTAVCKESGYLPNPNCKNIDTLWLPKTSMRFKSCPYHQLIYLDENEEYRVQGDCYPIHKMLSKSWFIMPPVMEYYFQKKSGTLKKIPEWNLNCRPKSDIAFMQIIYPTKKSKLFIPIEIDGKKGKSIFEVAHRNNNATIYWYIDEIYLGGTTNIHQMSINSNFGKHILTLIDNNGEILEQRFEIISN